MLTKPHALLVGIALTVFLATCAVAQAVPSLETGYRDMYNLQFQAAHDLFRQWESENPTDPLGPVSDAAAYLFAEFDRLHVLESELFIDNKSFEERSKPSADPKVKQAFQDQLAKAEELADKKLAKQPGNPDAMFAKAMAMGMRGDYAAMIEKRDLAGLSYTKSARTLAEQLLAKDPDYYDAYLAIGVENYLLSQQSAPMRWILRATGAQTDKEAGLHNLRLTAEHGHYLLPYARLLLAVAALRDHDRAQARDLLAGLAREFPENPLYAKELAKLQ